MTTQTDDNLVASDADSEEEITTMDLMRKLQDLNTCSVGELLNQEYTTMRYKSIEEISNELQRQEQDSQMLYRIQYVVKQLQPKAKVSTIKNRRYKTKLCRVLDASTFTSSLKHLDIIRLVAPHVPIKYNNNIFIDGYRFQKQNSDGRYKCEGCKDYHVKYGEYGNIWIDIKDFQNNKHRCRTKSIAKRNKLRDMIIEDNLRGLIRRIDRKISIKNIVEADFRRIRNKLPGLEDDNLPIYSNDLKDRLRKYKHDTFPCSYVDLSDYLKEGHAKVMEVYAPDPLCRKKIKDELILRTNGNDLLITHKESLKIFIKSTSMSADGTFKITPHFMVSDKPCRIHAQVVLIYAIYRYPVKITKKTKQKSWYRMFTSKSYLVAVALLTGKNKENYNWLFPEFYSLAQKYNYNNIKLQKTCIMDFEGELRKWAKESFDGEIKLSGEVFHHNKNIKRFISKKGCDKYYKRTYDSKKLHQPFPPNYDYLFRIHVESMYNLQYFTAPNIEEFGIKLCMSLYWHLFNKYDGRKPNRRPRYIPDEMLHFLVYMMKCWLNLTTSEIHTIFKQVPNTIYRKRYRKYVGLKASRLKATCLLQEWSVNGFYVKTNNLTEGKNLHIAKELGVCTAINVFMLNMLEVLSKNRVEYQQHQQQEFIPILQPKVEFRAKLNILENIEHKHLTFDQFLTVSEKLTMCKMDHNKKPWKDYFCPDCAGKPTSYPHPHRNGLYFNHKIQQFEYNIKDKEIDVKPRNKDIDTFIKQQETIGVGLSSIKIPKIQIQPVDDNKSTQILSSMHAPCIISPKENKRKRKRNNTNEQNKILGYTKNVNKNTNTLNVVKNKTQKEINTSQQNGLPTKRRKIINDNDHFHTSPTTTQKYNKLFPPKYPIFNPKKTHTNMYDENGRPVLLRVHNTRKFAKNLMDKDHTEEESKSESSDSDTGSQDISQYIMPNQQNANQTRSIDNGHLSHKRQYHHRNNSISNVYETIQTQSPSSNTTSADNERMKQNRDKIRIKRKQKEKHTKYPNIPPLETVVSYNTYL